MLFPRHHLTFSLAVSLALVLLPSCNSNDQPQPKSVADSSSTVPPSSPPSSAPSPTPDAPPPELPNATAARKLSRVEDPPNPKLGDLVKVREFHENGQLATERTERVVADGKRVRQGPMKAWHENGKVYVEGGYDDTGKKTGRWRYFLPDGTLELEGDYQDNLRERMWVRNWPNGQKHSEGLIHVGMLEGPWKYWHENGKQLAEGEYVNNLREGPWLFWLPDGTVDTSLAGRYVHHTRVE